MFQIFLYFLSGFSGFGLAIAIAVYFVIHPEKFEKWASMVGWIVSHFCKTAEYFATKSEIKGKINSFVGTLESKTNTVFPRVSVKWTGRDKEEIIWEDYEVIIVMRDRKYRNRNFVHAAYLFTSEALLRKSKRHLSKSQKTSLDLFATKKILDMESRAAVEQFMNDYLIPQTEGHEEIRELVQQFVHIDKISIFFPILIQELSSLGNKVFLTKPTDKIIKEVRLFIDFLERFSQREVGDITIPDTFVGTYTSCAVKIVASRFIRESGNVNSSINRISNALNGGLENVYIIGSGKKENKDFIDEVANFILQENTNVQLVKDYSLEGQIKIKGKLVKVDSYLLFLHNPDAVKYLYEQNDVESLI